MICLGGKRKGGGGGGGVLSKRRSYGEMIVHAAAGNLHETHLRLGGASGRLAERLQEGGKGTGAEGGEDDEGAGGGMGEVLPAAQEGLCGRRPGRHH